MGKFATALIAGLVLAQASPGRAQTDPPRLPSTLAYTYFQDGRRVGGSQVRIARDAGALRIESKLRVEAGPVVIDLTTRTEADPRTYHLRSFAFEGSKDGAPAGASVTVEGDSVFGWVSHDGTKSPRRRRASPGPVAVWEDWVMDLEILLGLQQDRAFRNPSTRALVMAASYTAARVTLGFTGEVALESPGRDLSARKLVVAIEGGAPFESMIDPERGVPVYIHFPAVQAEVFLDDFFGDNPPSRYANPPAVRSDR